MRLALGCQQPYRIATYASTKLNVADQAGRARVRSSRRGAAAYDNWFGSASSMSLNVRKTGRSGRRRPARS